MLYNSVKKAFISGILEFNTIILKQDANKTATLV
jgi:hypothetical protein